MKKLIIAIFILCLFFGAIGMAALPTPVLNASTSTELAGGPPPAATPPPPAIQILPLPFVAWNS